ncbi:MAG TPA: hypothetical protein VMW84_04100, partial [Acidobacteriota bacterium]|nr:hypothetical protein [Acidobacteriota bacterium]
TGAAVYAALKYLSAATNHIATYSAIQMRRTLSPFNCQQQIKCRTGLPKMCQNVPKEYRFVPLFFGIPARLIRTICAGIIIDYRLLIIDDWVDIASR